MPINETQLIEIIVNGEPCQVATGTTLVSLLQRLELNPERVAIELNRVIVRQPTWAGSTVTAGDRLEIVQFVGGG